MNHLIFLNDLNNNISTGLDNLLEEARLSDWRQTYAEYDNGILEVIEQFFAALMVATSRVFTTAQKIREVREKSKEWVLITQEMAEALRDGPNLEVMKEFDVRRAMSEEFDREHKQLLPQLFKDLLAVKEGLYVFRDICLVQCNPPAAQYFEEIATLLWGELNANITEIDAARINDLMSKINKMREGVINLLTKAESLNHENMNYSKV